MFQRNLPSRSDLLTIRGFLKHYSEGILAEFMGEGDPWLTKHHNKWHGESCFVLGNGPSLSYFSNEMIYKLPSFGTNGIFLRLIPSFYVTISSNFYTNHLHAIRSLSGCHKFIGDTLPNLHTGTENEHILHCHWNQYGSFKRWNYPVPLRFSHRADRVIHLGGTVLFVCLQLAYWLGFSTVYLLGVDHQFGFPRSEAKYGGRRLRTDAEDKLHFDPRYTLPGYTPHCDMIAIERSFELALSEFKKDGRKILNLSSVSGLDVIPKAKFEDLFG